jgi:aspartate aminotransferase
MEVTPVFESLEQLPPDAIIGIMALFRADPDKRKVDLSVGVFMEDDGRTPVLESVRKAELELLEQQKTKTYVAIAGNAGFNSGMQELVFGKGHEVLRDQRVATVQSPGGSGGLSVAGHLLHRAKPGASVHVSSPTWPNHMPLLKLSGLKIAEYPYYDYRLHLVDFEKMVDAVEKIPAGDILLLHGCCHNPCGADLSQQQWRVLAEICARRGIVPFVDFAYQGLSEGLDEDAYGARLMAEKVPELVVVASCSKNFGVYRERVGSVFAVCEDRETRDAVASNLANVARGIYSMPPDHGAAIVDRVLHDPKLRALWVSEVAKIRERINGLRGLLVKKLRERGVERDFSFIAKERGMFSFLGISKEQVIRLREEFHVYMVESSRINLAGINSGNADYVADSIAAVLKA